MGNKTGYDTQTEAILQQIPDTSYGNELGIAPVDGTTANPSETKYFQQINPADGNYILQLIGTGDGEYSLDFSKIDDQGRVTTQVINGVAKNGVTEIYQLQLNQI